MRLAPVQLAVLLTVSACVTSLFAFQEEGAPPKPGKEHQLLKQFVGKWDYTSKFLLVPGQDPVVSKGKETARSICGGLFVVFDSQGQMFGSKFEGHGTLGYDTQKKKYTGTWVDSMATGVYLTEGTVDESGKIFTEQMQGANPETGEPMTMKIVHEIKDENHRRMTFSMSGPDDKQMEMGSIEYTRVQK